MSQTVLDASTELSGIGADTVAIEARGSSGFVPLMDETGAQVAFTASGMHLLRLVPGREYRLNHTVASGAAVSGVLH